MEDSLNGAQPILAESEVVSTKTFGDIAGEHPWPKGVAPVKAEYLIRAPKRPEPDDDEAEAAKHILESSNGQKGAKPKNRGQNKNRYQAAPREQRNLCLTRAVSAEFSPENCSYGDKCRNEHDLRKYLSTKLPDLETMVKVCPLLEERGWCPFGWSCRFANSHSREFEHEDGRKELVLVVDEEKKAKFQGPGTEEFGVVNMLDKQTKIVMNRKKMRFDKSDKYEEWLNKIWTPDVVARNNNITIGEDDEAAKTDKEDNRAAYVDPPFLPSEKRRLYYGPETPILAPLTTQGNLPFRRLCVSLGAQFTFSEMAMGMPIVQGHPPEWALMKAHESEITPPKVSNRASSIVPGYDNSRDLKFGAQVSAQKPWVALKTTEALERFCPHLRAIDLNCGCPIDLVVKQGAGSALLDMQTKLEKMLRGMNALSGEIPITAKLRTGTKDGKPTAIDIAKRLLLGGKEARERGLGGCGVAAVTLHGRSKAQRYARLADWGYISEVAQVIKSIRNKEYEVTDTTHEPDARYGPNGNGGTPLFVGNGDVYSHEDYFTQIENAGVDGVMIGRGAMIKPWIFREIEAGQHLDPRPTERLQYIEEFVKYGLTAWGSDERGVGTTRRFLLEWLSFTYRYIPTGLLEVLPPRMNERPPPFKGRDGMETLLASDNYKDWIKISEMFLGKARDDFRFVPKHKSNSYEMEAEG